MCGLSRYNACGTLGHLFSVMQDGDPGKEAAKKVILSSRSGVAEKCEGIIYKYIGNTAQFQVLIF